MRLLADTASGGLQLSVMLARRLGGPDPLARLRALRGEIDVLLAEEITVRRAEPGEDILSLLIAARFEDGEPMDDAEIRDQLMTLLLAGHETTATGPAWTFDLLLRHPAAMARLVAEVDAGEEPYLRAVVVGRCACARSSPSPAGVWAGAARRRARAPGGNRRHAGDLAHPHPRRPLPGAVRLPPRAFPRERARDVRLGPVRRRRPALLGAAFAEMEMRVALAEILRRRRLMGVARTAERVARRNVTFSPRTARPWWRRPARPPRGPPHPAGSGSRGTRAWQEAPRQLRSRSSAAARIALTRAGGVGVCSAAPRVAAQVVQALDAGAVRRRLVAVALRADRGVGRTLRGLAVVWIRTPRRFSRDGSRAAFSNETPSWGSVARAPARSRIVGDRSALLATPRTVRPPGKAPRSRAARARSPRRAGSSRRWRARRS